ncbi:MAG: hypothetical protein BroJett026_23810 [Betaproteobacteria bacterium]|nr:MAG: hypothetical protein BroJett026_23810 [Betaproteobacteria bacterium]
MNAEAGGMHDIPFLAFIGARLDDWRAGVARVALPLGPQHLNRSGVVHGGLYSVLVDAAGGLSGLYTGDPAAPRKAFTLSLTTSFLDAVGSGTIVATGTVRRSGRRVYFATVEIHADDRRLLAVGEGSFLFRASAGESSRSARPAVNDDA